MRDAGEIVVYPGAGYGTTTNPAFTGESSGSGGLTNPHSCAGDTEVLGASMPTRSSPDAGATTDMADRKENDGSP
ncbi:hypothetical protein NKH52_08065 [Mesorhizobium sp. M1066]|uniref:hypothetical protein n=1 Tax=unclassified Mesorhizobium TaxID=325217 RepID=UPI0033385545